MLSQNERRCNRRDIERNYFSIQLHEDGRVEVSAINPEAMFSTIEASQAREIARDASAKMQAAIAANFA